MKLFVGTKAIDDAREKIQKEQIIVSSDSIVLASELPFMRIELSNMGMLFFWGDIYSVSSESDKQIIFKKDVKGENFLKELFTQNCDNIIHATNKLEGNFIGVYLGLNDDIHVFSDKLGRSDIFYHKDGNNCIVSSDIAPIISFLEKVTYSQVSLANMLNIYGYYAPKKETMYNEISRLGVGEQLICRENELRIEEQQFEPLIIKKYTQKENEIYAQLFEDSIRNRGTEDGINWVFLSSGWDSTSILALLVKIFGASKIRCVIGEMLYSERAGTINTFEVERAKKMADYFDVPLDIIPLDMRNEDAIEYWKSISESLKKQHIYSFSAANFYKLSEYIMENGSKDDNVFSGEISDGIHNFGFSQYATILDHPDLGFREYSDKMASYMFSPSFFQRVLDDDYKDDTVYKLLKERVGSIGFDDTKENLDEMGRRMKYFISFFMRPYRLPFIGLNNTKILTQEGVKLYEESISSKYLKEVAEKATPETFYSWILHLYNSFHWQGGSVKCLGAKFSAKGERLKLPFYDGKLFEFLSQMPENWGRGLEMRPTKYPLKWSLENKFDYPLHLQTGPHSYLYDVNPQFSHVSEVLYGSHVSSHFKSILKERPYRNILETEYFDLEYLDRLVDEYQNGIEHIGQERTDLMALVVLCYIGWY